MTIFYNFDEDGYYAGSAQAPIHPITREVAEINPGVATLKPLPEFDPQVQRCRWTGVAWDVELIPREAEPELELPALRYPVFFGNAKLDLFTQVEQLAVVTATMVDPQVKLMYDRLLGATFLTYEDPETEQGLLLLVTKGLLTQERKAQIVAHMQPK